MTEGPRTEAGKRLLAQDSWHPYEWKLERILAIEAEARADVDGLVARLEALPHWSSDDRGEDDAPVWVDRAAVIALLAGDKEAM